MKYQDEVMSGQGFYRGGPHMVAIVIMTGTKYACNHDNNEDLICLQSRLERGLNMLAITI